MMRLNQIILTAVIVLCSSFPALAQVDLSGSWGSKNHEDALERGAGPNPGDFTGVPFNESGRAKALSYSQSEISMPEVSSKTSASCALSSGIREAMGIGAAVGVRTGTGAGAAVALAIQ